jgi:hypothetical protein
MVGGLFAPDERRLTSQVAERKLRREVTSAPETLEIIMKRSLLFVCIGLLAATTASAQNPPAQSGPNNNAVNSPGQNNSNAPVAGRNSFTEGQASGSASAVSIDFQGNVNTAK